MYHPRRAIPTIAIVIAASLGVAACGSDEPSDAAPEAAAAEAEAAPAALLSANTASEDELMTIPGVGENIAHEITEYRPYEAGTGPDKFRTEMAKYIDAEEIERIMTYLDFEG